MGFLEPPGFVSSCAQVSWLSRGWCRAELWCHVLSNKPDTNIIVVHSAQEAEFMSPMDWQRNSIADGAWDYLDSSWFPKKEVSDRAAAQTPTTRDILKPKLRNTAEPYASSALKRAPIGQLLSLLVYYLHLFTMCIGLPTIPVRRRKDASSLGAF